MEGLVHISEVSWDHIDDLNKVFKIGQKIEVEIISTENNRLSLSIKRLLPDPWIKEAESFQVGQIVEGKVTKITPFGAFVKIGQLDALVHISELGENIFDPKEIVEEGKSFKFRILSIEPELHKLSLSLKNVKEKVAVKEKKKRTKKEK